MSSNLRIPLILSFLLISSCSQFGGDGKQEQILEEEPITAQASMTAALDGYLHFIDRCVVISSKDGGEGESTQLAILGDQAISDLTENTLVYEGKKYTEGDYIRVGGGYVNDSSTFKKEHNIDKCFDKKIFVLN